MFYVYSIQSESNPDSYYVGVTTNITQRLHEHNSNHSHHTFKFSPWKIICFTAFTDLSKAVAFEKYLKSGSGRAFAKKHF